MLSQSGLTFFGLTFNQPEQIKEYKFDLYRQIHQICFHGKGGYSWPIVYAMPSYLRKFIFEEIKNHYEEENKNSSSNSPNTKVLHQGSNSKPVKPVSTPNFSKGVSYK